MKTINITSVLFKALIFNALLILGFSCTPDIAYTESLNIQMVNIPAGKFEMGTPGNTHKDSTKGFWMSKHEITNAQFAEFLNAKKVLADGMYETEDYSLQLLILPADKGLKFRENKWEPDSVKYSSHPVFFVTWYGANEFAKYKDARLPTDTEWEYACRAGTKTLFNTGDLLPFNQANYDWSRPYDGDTNVGKTPSTGTSKIGSYAPNAYGLYDMHGNVWEWCTSLEDPKNPAISRKAIRGGSWNRPAVDSRSGHTQYFEASTFSHDWPIGFRIVISY